MLLKLETFYRDCSAKVLYLKGLHIRENDTVLRLLHCGTTGNVMSMSFLFHTRHCHLFYALRMANLVVLFQLGSIWKTILKYFFRFASANGQVSAVQGKKQGNLKCFVIYVCMQCVLISYLYK